MSKVLLDTDILSQYLKGRDKVVAHHAANYASQHGAFTFTSVTVHEIVFGVEFKGASSRLAKALAWLNQNEQITPSAKNYHDAAIIRATARKQGSIPELPDCLIAATALGLGGHANADWGKRLRWKKNMVNLDSYIDWTGCELVERIPGKVSGRPVVRDTRILADTIVQDAELGSSLEEILENYPDLSLPEIQRLISFAHARRGQPVP